MNRSKQDALSRWATALMQGEDNQSLWQSLTVPTAEFDPLAYVFMALNLPLWGQKALALACNRHWSGGDLDRISLCNCLGQWLSKGQLASCGAFDTVALEGGILRPNHRITAFVMEEIYDNPGVAGLSLWQPSPLPDSPMLSDLRNKISRVRQGTPVTFALWGEAGAGRRTLAKWAATNLDTPLLLADLARMSMDDATLTETLILECRLMGCPVCICSGDDTDMETLCHLLQTLAEVGQVCFLICDQPMVPPKGEEWRVFSVHLPLPDVKTRENLWKIMLKPYHLEPDVDVEHLSLAYGFTAGQMEQAITAAHHLACWQGETALTMDCLNQGCRSQLRHSLGDKAKRIAPSFTWDDLVLPAPSLELLHSACTRMHQRGQVLERWGFSTKLPYGGGLSLLFSGPPGTGKTMGAQILAGALGLELYKVDLATVVSKYVGETEKNLSVIFREAQRSGAVLFFDEADALFGKRTEIKDSHDRYSNMEAAYLLQKVEEYSGVSILATNYLQNIDDAFRRRLTYIVEFPFPNDDQRLELWSRVFPRETPLDDQIDWAFLSQSFELSGSSIKNCAVAAAYLAAGAGSHVTMGHILLAVRRELEKSGKTISKEEFGPYYMLLL
ncbi:MAG: ATP-binding protein [Eubacteriales bacterium]